MANQKYNIKWHTYSEQLQVTMRKLMTSPDFTDVTFVCEDKKLIRAHKNILNECSPALKEIFQIERSLNSIIYLKGINHSDMELILHFIYLGEATFNEERLNDFLSVAKSLEIKGLISEEEICTTDNAQADNEVIPIDETADIILDNFNCFAMPFELMKKHFLDENRSYKYSVKIRNLKQEAKDENEESGISDTDE